jgi:hypothetical protein
MRQGQWLGWAGAAVLAALVGVVAWRLASAGTPARPAADLDAVMARLDAMQARSDAHEQALRDELQRLQRQVGVPHPAAPPVPEPSPEAMAAQMHVAAEQQQRALERLFSGQGAAPAHDPAPRALDAAFANPGVLEADGQPLARDVQCRAQLCLITARFKPNEDGGEWATRVLMELAATLPSARMVTVALPGGGAELRVYAARAGERDPFAGVP